MTPNGVPSGCRNALLRLRRGQVPRAQGVDESHAAMVCQQIGTSDNGTYNRRNQNRRATPMHPGTDETGRPTDARARMGRLCTMTPPVPSSNEGNRYANAAFARCGHGERGVQRRRRDRRRYRHRRRSPESQTGDQYAQCEPSAVQRHVRSARSCQEASSCGAYQSHWQKRWSVVFHVTQA